VVREKLCRLIWLADVASSDTKRKRRRGPPPAAKLAFHVLVSEPFFGQTKGKGQQPEPILQPISWQAESPRGSAGGPNPVASAL